MKLADIQVRPGPDGYKQFTEAIRKAFNLPEDSELNITFVIAASEVGRAVTALHRIFTLGE